MLSARKRVSVFMWALYAFSSLRFLAHSSAEPYAIGSKCGVSICVFWTTLARPEPVTFAVVISLRNVARP